MAIRAKPQTYRGISIEQERDWTFSLYDSSAGYLRGNFKTVEEAKEYIDEGKNPHG